MTSFFWQPGQTMPRRTLFTMTPRGAGSAYSHKREDVPTRLVRASSPGCRGSRSTPSISTNVSLRPSCLFLDAIYYAPNLSTVLKVVSRA